MINISKIRSLEKLEEMRSDLNFFINKKIIADLYAEQGKDPYELKVEREEAREILMQVLNRIKELKAKTPILSES